MKDHLPISDSNHHLPTHHEPEYDDFHSFFGLFADNFLNPPIATLADSPVTAVETSLTYTGPSTITKSSAANMLVSGSDTLYGALFSPPDLPFALLADPSPPASIPTSSDNKNITTTKVKQHPIPSNNNNSNAMAAPSPATSNSTNGTYKIHAALRMPDVNLEDVAPWSTLSVFLQHYLNYMHCLVPLVHKPTFAQDLIMGREKHDKQFRALVFGLVSLTIGQSPLSKMQGFERSELERLHRDCHRASMILLNRTFHRPTLTQLIVLMT